MVLQVSDWKELKELDMKVLKECLLAYLTSL